MKRFLIKIEYIQEHTYCSVNPIQITFNTDNIEWTMEQYQRNREPFKWEVISEEII